MCGINGLYDFRKNFSRENNWELVHQMNEKIIYRGPNHEGMYQHENLTMGMRRLAIQDLNLGNQPIYNETKNLIIIFNGEVYNFKNLRLDLESKGHIFYTQTDTEVIVHAYEEYSYNFLDKLDGMFALSIYNKVSGELLVARDRMGEKPLYYFKNEDVFLWGSELKSLIGTGIPKRKISISALNQYLQLTYIPAPLSIYENIYKLMPGHYLIVDKSGKIKDEEYWNLRNIKKDTSITYEEAQRKLEELVKKSVRERMISDVPLGAFLSGGIDSSSIVSIMSGVSEKPIETFTMGFNEKEYDERYYARMVARENHTNHHEYILDYNEMLKSIDDILQKMDEPFADSSIIPTYFVSKFAGEHVKVVLTGDAGDELFLGYSKYLINYYSNLLHHLPIWLQCAIRKIVLKLPDKSSITRKMRKVLNCIEKDVLEQRKELMSLGFKEEERKQLLKSNYYDDSSLDVIEDRYMELSYGSEWTRTQYTDLSIVLEGDMLAKVDRMSMLNSIETRTPLLSREIVEFAFSLPDEYKIRKKKLKCIMKDTFSNILPRELLKIKKSGFGVPLDFWFRNQLKGWIEQLLDPNEIEKQGIFNKDYVSQILQEHFTGKVNRKSEIWALIVFQKWYKREFCNIE